MKSVIHSKPERKRKHRLVRALYRRRYLVELFFHNLKRFRAIATRYDKTARNYLALVHLACAWLWLN
jgi:transposase